MAKGYKPKVSRTPTAEEIQKQDITLRWIEFINAVGRLKRRVICKDGSVIDALSYFLEKFYAFYYATQFYVDEDKRKTVQNLFSVLERKNVNPSKILKIADEYAQECYRKGLFIEEEVIAEEGEW